MEEQEIISLLLRRDETGLEELLCHYGPLMRYIIAPILPNREDQEECLSEAAMRVWDKIELFDPEKGGWAAWLTALTRNTALNLARRGAAGGGQDIPPHLPAPDPTPEQAILEQERRTAVGRALNALAPGERALFYRKYYYLQSTAQIAAELGTTQRAVEGKLYRLKKRLRRMLGGEADG